MCVHISVCMCLYVCARACVCVHTYECMSIISRPSTNTFRDGIHQCIAIHAVSVCIIILQIKYRCIDISMHHCE